MSFPNNGSQMAQSAHLGLRKQSAQKRLKRLRRDWANAKRAPTLDLERRHKQSQKPRTTPAKHRGVPKALRASAPQSDIPAKEAQ